MDDEPAFPPPPPRRDAPKPVAPTPPRRTKPLMDDLEPREGGVGGVDRRWGCVIPLAVVGVALSIGGASIVFDWWSKGGTISIYLLVLCVLGGPGLLLFARGVYRNPDL